MARLWSGGPEYDDDPAFKITTDSVLLAYFAGQHTYSRCMDLGCGGGLISVLMHAERPAADYDGVDIRSSAVEQCRKNFRANGMGGAVLCADARDRRALGTAGSYDLVVCNPPYYYAGPKSPDPERAASRGGTLSPAQFSGSASYLLRRGGTFCLVHKPEFLTDIFSAMRLADIEPKRLRLVCNTADSEPALVLVAGRRGGKPGLAAEPCLLLRGDDGRPTPLLREIYHMR